MAATNITLQLCPDSQDLALLSTARPPCPADGAVLAMRACGFCGSDLDKIRRPHAGAILGHELVGVIDELGPEAQAQNPGLHVGQRVAVSHHVPCGTCYYCVHQSPSMCRQFKATNLLPGGFSRWVVLGPHHLSGTVFPLSEALSDAEATVIEPLACVLRAVDRLPAPREKGPSVAVTGLGFIGLLAAMVLTKRGYQVAGLDLNPERADLAMAQGWLHLATANRTELEAQLKAKTQGRGVDTVFLTVVTPQTIQQAFSDLRDGGTLMIFAGSGKAPFALDQDAIYHREITVMSSYSPSLPHLNQAHQLLEAGDFWVKPLLTHTCQLENLLDSLSLYTQGEAIKLVVTP